MKKAITLLRTLAENAVKPKDIGIARKWKWTPNQKIKNVRECSPTTEYSSTED